ncbi:hypothetical protein OU798_18765 [Prolixibacteraceae bacterium Z1-6]|uniref:Uncharacterized protein n=1 Tax=Draconibacterium aestuarii TaxID=2998507 RepID=A0A9X3J7E5_9BACT|nr:hypothetical protein [Prolixibacteraceae bacterium Z1-6]
MEKEYLIVGLTVGYMLKVMKSKKTISKFKEEFAAIRHGDYVEFINLINEPIPEMVVHERGKIEVNPPLKNNDIDMIQIVKAGPSLNKFQKLCFQEYGGINDSDISDKIFYEVAIFELSLRVHANNRKLLEPRDNFETVIIVVSESFDLNDKDKNQLQRGRRFLNMIKHFNNQFDSWETGTKEFLKASKILDKYKLTIL